MTYTALTAREFREKNGVLTDKLGDEFRLIGDELAALAERIAAIEEAAIEEA